MIRFNFARLSVFTFVFFVFAPLSFAGGGNYSIRTVNKGVVGKSPSEIVAIVYDFSGASSHKDEFGTGLIVGEEFRFHINGPPEDGRCETTQSKSNEKGEVKALCFSNRNGVIPIHVEPLTRRDLGDSASYDVFFSDPGETDLTTFDQENPYSAAPAPCGSGMKSLQYDYPNECPTTEMKTGKILCNNGFVARFTSPECKSQQDEGYWSVVEQYCVSTVCSAAGLQSITTGPFTVKPLLKPTALPKAIVAPKPVTASPTPFVPSVQEQTELSLDSSESSVIQQATESAVAEQKEKSTFFGRFFSFIKWIFGG